MAPHNKDKIPRDRFCTSCKTFQPKQSSRKRKNCIKCDQVMPAINTFEHSEILWWGRCEDCFGFIRSDFKFCELCGFPTTESLKHIRLDRTQVKKEKLLKKLKEEEMAAMQTRLEEMEHENKCLKNEITLSLTQTEKDPKGADK